MNSKHIDAMAGMMLMSLMFAMPNVCHGEITDVPLSGGVVSSDGGPYTETVDGVEWTFMVTNGVSSVGTGVQDGTAISSSTIGEVAVPESLGGHPVTCIADYAFYDCIGLTGISIPPSVTNVGNSAFQGCRALKNATVPGWKCGIDFSSITNLVISEGTTNVPNNAFKDCSALENVSMPISVVSIGTSAFFGCSGLSCMTIPKGVKDITPGAFRSCGRLTRFIVDPDNIAYQSINDMLVSKDGSTLVVGVNGEVKIPSCVTSIGDYAFAGYNIASVTMPSGVATLGNYAFHCCDNLTNIVFIGNAPQTLFKVFANGAKGKIATVYSDTTGWDDDGDGIWNELTLCYRARATPTEVVNGVTWSYVTSNGSVKVVSASNMSSESVIVPETVGGEPVTGIGSEAFLDCGEMTSVTIPASVTEIGSDAFCGCEKLADVYFEGDTIVKIGRHAFLGCSWNLIMHVPASWQGRGRTIAGYTVWRDGSLDEEKSVSMTVTNVVVQYVLNSVQSSMATPVGEAGLVNIITEVKSAGAVSVPTEWQTNYPMFETKYGTDFAKALMTKTGKKDAAGGDMFVWQDFVAGTDPTDPESKFVASVTMVGGVPVISYSPELSETEKAKRVYRTLGKAKIADAEWTEVPAGSESDYNFFKVTVEMK